MIGWCLGVLFGCCYLWFACFSLWCLVMFVLAGCGGMLLLFGFRRCITGFVAYLWLWAAIGVCLSCGICYFISGWWNALGACLW